MKPPLQPGADAIAVGVVIPTLNEADGIERLLDDLAGLGFAEIVVADGGSQDRTAALARARPATTVVSAPPGRGPQLNAGAGATCSPALLFLHADSRPPPDVVERIATTLADPRVVGGAFRIRFDHSHPVLALYGWAGRFETALTTFGDQGFFVRRSALEAAGGFPDWPILEDVEMRRRLRRLGRFVKVDAIVLTSARRYLAEGIIRRQWLNLRLLLDFWRGGDPARLARRYRARRAVRLPRG